jgi:hypothetical protein
LSTDLPELSAARDNVERRARVEDRRQQPLKALWVGSIRPRRHTPRRQCEHNIASIDWHHPQWLAVGLLILLLSCADAFLTLTVLNLGANEANPFMLPLVQDDGRSFALWKFGLTAVGVTVLILLARARAFGWLPVAFVLYAILALYVGLVGYELWLLERLSILAL